MNSSFGTTVAKRRRPHFRHFLASGPLTDQLCTSRFGERGISTPTCWGLLKQPDNQKPTTALCFGRDISPAKKYHQAVPPTPHSTRAEAIWLPHIIPHGTIENGKSANTRRKNGTAAGPSIRG